MTTTIDEIIADAEQTEAQRAPDDTADAGRRDGLGRSILGGARSALLWVGAVLGLGCALLFVIALLFGIQPQAVVSGSMEPTLPKGSLILVSPAPASQVEVGDIVTVPLPDGRGTVTHRVVATDTDRNGVVSLTLKGDANRGNDPVPYPVATVGEHILTIPLLGTVALAFRTPFGLAAIILVALVFLVAVFVPGPERRRRPRR